MKKKPWSLRVSLVLLMISLHALPAGATDPVQLADSVTSYDLAAPKLFWYSKPICTPTISSAGDFSASSLYAEKISRIATHGGLIRTLYSQDVATTCPQQILDVRSNIVADADYVYWMSNSLKGVARLPVTANIGDAPTLLSGAVSGSAELTHDGGNVYVLSSNAGVWRISKADGAAEQRLLGSGTSVRNFQTDGKYLYWINSSGSLIRLTATGSLWYVNIANNVTGYYPEGRNLKFCTINPFQCYYSEYVFIAQGNKVIRYDNLDSAATVTVYTGADPSAMVYTLVSSPALFAGDLYFFESRQINCGQLLCNYENRLYRTGRGGGAVDTLYIKTGTLPVQKMADYIRADATHLFWQDSGALMRLPKDATPVDNLSITGLEITQGIQDLANSVRLVQNRRTFVRLYVKSDRAAAPGVTARLYRVNSLGSVIGGPLVPINPVGQQITVQKSPNRNNLNDSFLFELPWSWTASSLRLRAQLNPDKVPIETSYTDNTATYGTYTFDPSPRLEVQFVSFGYILNNKYYYPRLIDDVLQTYSWIRRAYPLASTPGTAADPSPGFRPNLWIVADGGLGSRVNQTHADCLAIEAKYRNLCASAYTNTLMDAMRAEDGVPSHVFMYGMISDAAGWFPRGQACCGEKVSSGPVGIPGVGSWDTDTTYGDWYAAHEIGHTLGRAHPAENSDDPATENVTEGCGHSRDDWSYPYFDAHIGAADGSLEGFDVGDPAFGLPMRVYPGVTWFDVMSYCPNEWISDYTYEAMYDFMIASAASAQSVYDGYAAQSVSGDFLSAYGLIFPDKGTALINRLRRVGTVGSIPLIRRGAYSIRLLDKLDAVLADYSFTASPVYDSDQTAYSFGQIVNFAAGTVKVRIVENRTGKVLVERKLSTNPPTISSVRLTGTVPNPVSGIVTLGWTANDADNDPLSFDISYSRDNGSTFMPLMVNVAGGSAKIDTATLGGSSTALFRVVASDGTNSAAALSPTYRMANKPPEVRILTPSDGLQMHYGQLINFAGEVVDLQDTNISSINMQWSSQRGTLGTGPTLTLTDLPVGIHTITFRATNSLGLSGASFITVRIDDDLDLPGPTLSAGPMEINWHVEADSTQVKTAQITISNAGSGNLSWKAIETADWLALSISSGTAPAVITLTGNPANILSGTTRTEDILIESTDPVGQSITIPVIFSKGDVWRDFASVGVTVQDIAAQLGRTNCRNDCKANFDGDVDVDGMDLATFGKKLGNR